MRPDTLLNNGNQILMYDDGSTVEIYSEYFSGDELVGVGGGTRIRRHLWGEPFGGQRVHCRCVATGGALQANGFDRDGIWAGVHSGARARGAQRGLVGSSGAGLDGCGDLCG